MSGRALLSGVGARPGTRLERLLGEGLQPVAPERGVTGCLSRIVAEVDSDGGPGRRTLPEGAALPEATAVRLREAGVELQWDAPVALDGLKPLLRLCRERGQSSIDLIRSDPRLLCGLQIGAWFDAPWRTRLMRRLPGAAAIFTVIAPISRRYLFAAADLAFWAGVRQKATPAEWQRLTRCSYSVLLYHRFAGEGKPGQERLDISPRRFGRQIRALRVAGFRPVSAERLLSFHAGGASLPRRAFAITVDDATADCVEPLTRHAGSSPQLFVPTAEVGGAAHWLDREPVATWDQLRALAAAGVAIGSHGRQHRRLTELDSGERSAALLGSLEDLRREIGEPLAAVAFPNGAHDAELCRRAEHAGFHLAYTTEKGLNGGGTDPHCLKRVSVHERDGVAAILWKTLTGRALPGLWTRIRT